MSDMGQQGGSIHACVHQMQRLASSSPDLCIAVTH